MFVTPLSITLKLMVIGGAITAPFCQDATVFLRYLYGLDPMIAIQEYSGQPLLATLIENILREGKEEIQQKEVRVSHLLSLYDSSHVSFSQKKQGTSKLEMLWYQRFIGSTEKTEDGDVCKNHPAVKNTSNLCNDQYKLFHSYDGKKSQDAPYFQKLECNLEECWITEKSIFFERGFHCQLLSGNPIPSTMTAGSQYLLGHYKCVYQPQMHIDQKSVITSASRTCDCNDSEGIFFRKVRWVVIYLSLKQGEKTGEYEFVIDSREYLFWAGAPRWTIYVPVVVSYNTYIEHFIIADKKRGQRYFTECYGKTLSEIYECPINYLEYRVYKEAEE